MAKEKTKKKRDAEGQVPPYNGSEVHASTSWPARWPHPRPETYYGAPYNAYDWAHAWPSHMRGDTNFPADFGAFPRGGFPYPGGMQPGPMPPSATPPAMGTTPPRASPHSSNLSGKSQSEGSSFSETGDTPQDPNGEAGGTGNKHKRRRKNTTAAAAAGRTIPELKNGSRDLKGKQQSGPDENTAKNKRYGIEEVKDLVKFRTDLQSKFETMSTHLELWTSIGEKMCEKGHPRRQWESYRDKWDIELRRYQKELKILLAQAGVAENKELEHPEQLVFSDDTLQEIHTRLNSRPKAALRSRFQSGVGGARGCLSEENATAKEVAGKRMKKAANNQVLVDSIVDKVVDKIGTFDETASAQGFKEVLDAVVNLTNVMLAEANPQPGGYTEFEIDDKVFGWLKSIGKEQYASYFAASHVDWTNLLLLDKDDLMEMKIPIGPRKFILRELEKLRPPESAATQLKHSQNSSIPEQQPEAETV